MCRRLEVCPGQSLDHRRAARNVLRLRADKNVLLISVGVFSGDDDEVLDEELSVTFDRSTHSIGLFDDNGLEMARGQLTRTTREGREAVRKRSTFYPRHTASVVFEKPFPVLEADRDYDLEHGLYPTDVENHYSGFPFTRLGAELWTCFGDGGNASQTVEDVQFRFSPCPRKGRDCLVQGQIPFFLFWKF